MEDIVHASIEASISRQKTRNLSRKDGKKKWTFFDKISLLEEFYRFFVNIGPMRVK